MLRKICRVVGIQQVQPGASDLYFPRANPNLRTWQSERDPQPFTAIRPQRPDRQLARFVHRIERQLITVRVQLLSKVSLLIQEADCHNGDAEVACSLQLVTRDVA